MFDSPFTLITREIEKQKRETTSVFTVKYNRKHTRCKMLWWHISATKYEIAIVIILENFHENSKFQGNFIWIVKSFL